MVKCNKSFDRPAGLWWDSTGTELHSGCNLSRCELSLVIMKMEERSSGLFLLSKAKMAKGTDVCFAITGPHRSLNVLKFIKNAHKDRFTLVSFGDLEKIKKSKAAAAA